MNITNIVPNTSITIIMTETSAQEASEARERFDYKFLGDGWYIADDRSWSGLILFQRAKHRAGRTEWWQGSCVYRHHQEELDKLLGAGSIITGKFAILYTSPNSDAAWVFQTESEARSHAFAGEGRFELWEGLSGDFEYDCRNGSLAAPLDRELLEAWEYFEEYEEDLEPYTPVETRPCLDGVQRRFEFENGYGASVVRHSHSYGGPSGFWELAVLKGEDLCYDTEVTGDVEGWLDEETVQRLLRQIAALPKESDSID